MPGEMYAYLTSSGTKLPLCDPKLVSKSPLINLKVKCMYTTDEKQRKKIFLLIVALRKFMWHFIIYVK